MIATKSNLLGQQHPFLGLPGLDATHDQLLAGGLYALHYPAEENRLTLLLQTIHTNLLKGQACALCTSVAGDQVLAQAAALGMEQIATAWERGDFVLFNYRAFPARYLQQYGISRLLAELPAQAVPQHALVVFDFAETLFNLISFPIAVGQVSDYANWFAQQRSTAIFAFGRADTTGFFPLLIDHFNGLAAATENADAVTTLFLQNWQTPQGTYESLQVELTPLPSGWLAVNHPSSRMETGDEVFYFDALLDPLANDQQGLWIRTRDIDELFRLTSAAQETVLFTYTNDTPLNEHALDIHHVRTVAGPHCRIVVREISTTLRTVDRHILLGLGADLIVDRSVPWTDLPSLLKKLVPGNARNEPMLYEDAVRALSNALAVTHCAPTDFATEVAVRVKRTQGIEVAHVLFELSCNHAQVAAQLAQKLAHLRHGDLFTNIGNQVWLFLYGCPEERAKPTLERMLQDLLGSQQISYRMVTTATQIIEHSQRINGLANQAASHVPMPSTSPPTPAPAATAGTIHTPQTAPIVKPVTAPSIKTEPVIDLLLEVPSTPIAAYNAAAELAQPATATSASAPFSFKLPAKPHPITAHQALDEEVIAPAKPTPSEAAIQREEKTPELKTGLHFPPPPKVETHRQYQPATRAHQLLDAPNLEQVSAKLSAALHNPAIAAPAHSSQIAPASGIEKNGEESDSSNEISAIFARLSAGKQ